MGPDEKMETWPSRLWSQAVLGDGVSVSSRKEGGRAAGWPLVPRGDDSAGHRLHRQTSWEMQGRGWELPRRPSAWMVADETAARSPKGRGTGGGG